MVKRWQHTRGSNSMRLSGRGEAISRRHVARRSHGNVVRVGHGCTGQLTLGRSPELVGGRPLRGPVGGGRETTSCRPGGWAFGRVALPVESTLEGVGYRPRGLPLIRPLGTFPPGGRIRWLSIRWGRPNVGSYASVYAIGHRPPSPARAAVSNIQDHIAGAGDGSMANWGVRVVSGASNPI